MIEYDNGIHLKGSDLWFDSRDPQDLCFVSHAHMDHMGSHAQIIVSHPTAAFYEQRMRVTDAVTLDYEQAYEIGGMRLTLYPAGHILGSAQLLIERDGDRILYSGDFKMRPNVTAEKIHVPKADVLIMEATYGNPHYLFPDRDVVVHEVKAAIDRALAAGEVPVILAYSLGKGQEIAKLLGDAGYELLLHKTIYDLMKTYRRFGVSFNNCERYKPSALNGKKVVLMPPYVSSSNVMDGIARKKIFLMSGWALGERKMSYHVDHIFPLSDHADFNELVDYVRLVNPKKVYVTHGDQGFVGHLHTMGYDAEYLGR